MLVEVLPDLRTYSQWSILSYVHQGMAGRPHPTGTTTGVTAAVAPKPAPRLEVAAARSCDRDASWLPPAPTCPSGEAEILGRSGMLEDSGMVPNEGSAEWGGVGGGN